MAAASIQKQLVALGLKNNGILYRNSAVGSRYPDKSKADYYAVIKRSKYAGFPGLIVEHAYVSNHDDSTTFLNGNDRLKRLGVADATGIAEYFDLILDQAPVLQTPVVNADESVTLAWNTVQGADYYRIYRRIAGTKTYVCLEETEETGYTDTGVMPGTSYEYTVCGCHVGYQKDSYTKNCAGSADNRYRGKREYTKCTKKSKLRWGMETTDVDKMKKLSTVRNQKCRKIELYTKLCTLST